MQIKVLCKKFLDGRAAFYQDEIREVSDEDGAYFCACGWAEDTTGTVPTGEIKPGHTKLDIRGIKRTQTSEVKNG